MSTITSSVFSSTRAKLDFHNRLFTFQVYPSRWTRWVHAIVSIVSIESYVISATWNMLSIPAIIVWTLSVRVFVDSDTDTSLPPSIYHSLFTTSRLRESELTFLRIKRTPMCECSAAAIKRRLKLTGNTYQAPKKWKLVPFSMWDLRLGCPIQPVGSTFIFLNRHCSRLNLEGDWKGGAGQQVLP